MTTPPHPPSRFLIARKLRAAGCVFAEDEARLLISVARSPGDLADMVDRRIAGLPLEHVVGWTEFCGLRVAVDPGVFVPRRRTEFLVEQAVALLRPDPGLADQILARPPAVVVDLCCGSGAVGAALVEAIGTVEVHAVDIDPVAVRCARRNLAGPRGHVYEGDLYDALPSALLGRVGVVVANAPYVPTGAIGLLPAESRMYEPRVALDGGADGLDIQRRVAAAAASWLLPGGHLLVETSERQAQQTVAAFVGGGLLARVVRREELDATVVVGTRSARSLLAGRSDDASKATPAAPTAAGLRGPSPRARNRSSLDRALW